MRRLAPRIDHVQALLGLATGAQVLRMHIEAKRAAVKLRDAIVDKVGQLRRETRPFYCLTQRQHSFVSVRIRLGIVEALLHGNLRSPPHAEPTPTTAARS